jgi:hypothetical protein
MEDEDRKNVEEMLGDYETQWKNTKSLYWKERKLREETENEKRKWEEKLFKLRRKLQQEINVREVLEKQGFKAFSRINRVKVQLATNEYLIQDAREEFEKLIKQLEYLKGINEEKREMEEQLRTKNFLIKRRILKFKKIKNENDNKGVDVTDYSFLNLKSPKVDLKHDIMIPDFVNTKKEKPEAISWEVINKRAFLDGEEISPENLLSDYAEGSNNITDSLGFDQFGNSSIDSLDLSLDDKLDLPELDKDLIVRREFANVGDLDLNQNNKKSSRVKVKRRIKRATFKKKGLEGLFN